MTGGVGAAADRSSSAGPGGPAPSAGGTVGRAQGYVGQALLRREDPALLTGRGQYVDDVRVPAELGEVLHAYMVRSPVAHARITSVDVDAARGADGVVAVLTAADLDAAG